MINIDKYEENFIKIRDISWEIETFIAELLSAFKKEGFITSISSRPKKYESILEKIKKKNEDDDAKVSFNDIKDIIGIKVICITNEIANAIYKSLLTFFPFATSDNKSKYVFVHKDLEYSDHPNIKTGQKLILHDWYKGIHIDSLLVKSFFTTYGELNDIPVEIQIHTLGSDLWSKLTHDTFYKSKTEYDHAISLSRLSTNLIMIDDQISKIDKFSFSANDTWKLNTYSNIKNILKEMFGMDARIDKPTSHQEVLKLLDYRLGLTKPYKRKSLFIKWTGVDESSLRNSYTERKKINLSMIGKLIESKRSEDEQNK